MMKIKPSFELRCAKCGDYIGMLMIGKNGEDIKLALASIMERLQCYPLCKQCGLFVRPGEEG